MTEYILHLLQMMGTTLRLPVSFVVIEFIGTMAFAISGIRLASAKQFDWFGAYIVGTATAVGGGTIRDIMLGIPPFWMTNPVYIICCGLSLLLRHIVRKENHPAKEHLVHFRHHRLGSIQYHGVGKDAEHGIPCLDSRHHGVRHRCRRRRHPRHTD